MAQPVQPELKSVGLIALIFGKRRKIEAENTEATRKYEFDLAKWITTKSAFESQQSEEVKRFDERLHADIDFMHDVLAENLSSIVWPRETLVSFQIDDQAESVEIDVDLPEIEDLQRKTASVPGRGYKLTLKDIKGKALHELYAQHVHAVGFRIIGEAFATLPTVMVTTLSAFTQRNCVTTGHVDDSYIYSVRAQRTAWSELNFSNLSAIDVVASFERFELRRKFAKNGTLEAITPLEVSAQI